jgi:SAM-dependent methyltransferase
MSDPVLIFDRTRIRANRDRGASHPGHDFLHEWCARALVSRLDDVKRGFPLAVSIGASGLAPLHATSKIGTLIASDLSQRRLRHVPGLKIHADEEFLPFAAGSLDLILSPLALHTANDLPGVLLQIRRALKPDGLFMAAMLGGETLHELRQVMADAEMNLRGGLSPRIFPFADKPQMGSLLQRADFSLPVVDSEIVTVTYEDAFKLMRDIRMMGEGNAIIRRDRSFAGKTLFMDAAHLYQERFSGPDGRIEASFEVIFLIGWSPHESQQKPLKPGSATSRLADILCTDEINVPQ